LRIENGEWRGPPKNRRFFGVKRENGGAPEKSKIFWGKGETNNEHSKILIFIEYS